MESSIMVEGIDELQRNGVHPFDISVDGSTKLPKLVESINESNEICDDFEEIKLSCDRAHTKVKLPNWIMKCKRKNDWDHPDWDGNIRGFNEEFARVVIDKLFQFAFHNKEVKTLDDCWDQIIKVGYTMRTSHIWLTFMTDWLISLLKVAPINKKA